MTPSGPCRRVVVWICLLLYALVASGLPLPMGTLDGSVAARLAEKDRSKPFPCMNKPCGCRSAKQCFAKCCCHTAAERLAGSTVMVCTVVGFPLGAMTRLAKAEEARITVAEGADEVDMVLDIGGLISGDLAAVYDDILGVVGAARPAPVKVILETSMLTDEQKAIACLIALRSGAAYVKTSTGFGGGGANVHDIALMRAMVGDTLGVKASGAVRSRQDATAMLKAGADRIGASSSVAIVSGGEAATGDY